MGASQIIPTLDSTIRVSSNISVGYNRTTHEFSCAEENPLLCEVAQNNGLEIPDLEERKQFVQSNWMQTMNYALNSTTQLRLQVPVVFQSVQYTYSKLADGSAYTPPTDYPSLFHPEHTYVGLGDAQLAVQRFFFLPKVVIGTEIGTRLPTGSTKFSQYSLEDFHQPVTTGTVVPLFSLMLFTRGTNDGWVGNVQSQLPVYANSDAYRTGKFVSLDAGYWKKVATDYRVLGQVRSSYETGDTWHEVDIPTSNRMFVYTGVMLTKALSKKQIVDKQSEMMLRVDIPVYGNIFSMPSSSTHMSINTLYKPTLSIGMTWL